ncbi:MAG: hypothetical protein O3C60_15280, partial [Planctomycetota bacterium]|nr:hypothetical protein [Planctomycetota bacterium]
FFRHRRACLGGTMFTTRVPHVRSSVTAELVSVGRCSQPECRTYVLPSPPSLSRWDDVHNQSAARTFFRHHPSLSRWDDVHNQERDFDLDK